MASDQVLQHFHPSEQEFIDKVLDWQDQVTSTYAPVLTPFLNPRQRIVLSQVLGRSDDFYYVFWGGYPEAENQRCLLAPNYFTWQYDDFSLLAIEIDYPRKFHHLEHRQILGAILKSGIKRDRLGDIINHDDVWQFFVDEAIAAYLSMEVKRIGRSPVSFECLTNAEQIISAQSDWTVRETLVTSLRLDAVISEAWHISRAKAKNLITAGAVKINWLLTESANNDIHLGDIISVRGYGRLRLDDIGQVTRKGKQRIQLGIIANK